MSRAQFNRKSPPVLATVKALPRERIGRYRPVAGPKVASPAAAAPRLTPDETAFNLAASVTSEIRQLGFDMKAQQLVGRKVSGRLAALYG